MGSFDPDIADMRWGQIVQTQSFIRKEGQRKGVSDKVAGWKDLATEGEKDQAAGRTQ